MLLPMAVASDRQDPPAELAIQAQNIDRRRQVLKSIAMTGGIDLYALAVRNDRFQDLEHCSDGTFAPAPISPRNSADCILPASARAGNPGSRIPYLPPDVRKV